MSDQQRVIGADERTSRRIHGREDSLTEFVAVQNRQSVAPTNSESILVFPGGGGQPFMLSGAWLSLLSPHFSVASECGERIFRLAV